MKEKPDNYKVAFKELTTIVQEMESETIDIDTLSEKVKQAETLISFCKDKLTVTENEVAAIFKQLDNVAD